MALLLEEIEQDEPAAHPLDEVTSRKDSQTQQLQSPLEDAYEHGRVEFKVALRGQRIACSGIEDEEQVYLIHHQYKLLPHVLLLKSRVILV